MPKLPLPPITDEEEARIQAGIAQDPENPEITEEQYAVPFPVADRLDRAAVKVVAHRPGLDGHMSLAEAAHVAADHQLADAVETK